jgi:capsular exopolysaccharide synthesis family protein
MNLRLNKNILEEEYNRLNFLDFLRIVNKRKVSIVITFFAALLLTLFYTYLQQPRYISMSYVAIGKPFDFIEQQTYIPIAKPDDVKSPLMIARISKALKSTDKYTLPESEVEIKELLHSSITVRMSSNDHIEIRVITDNPYLSADIANTTAEIFVNTVWNDQQESSKKIQQYLIDRIPELRDLINNKKQEIDKVKNISRYKNEIQNLQNEKIILIESIEEVNKEISKLQKQIHNSFPFEPLKNEYTLNEVNNIIESTQRELNNYISRGFVITYVDVQNVLQQLIAYNKIKLDIKQNRLIVLEEQINQKDKDIVSLQKYFGEVFTDADAEDLYRRRLERELQTYEEQLSHNIKKYEDTVSEFKGKIPYIKFHRAARPAIKPFHPDWGKNIYIGITFGLIFSIVYVLIFENFDPTLDDIKKLKAVTNYPVVGYIPYSPEVAKSSISNVRFLLTKTDIKSLFAEAIRVLKINVSYSLTNYKKENIGSVIAITSTNKGEGKSTVILNLGISLSQANKKVLMIGCNLRRPSLYKFFALKSTKGVIQYCEGKEKIEYDSIINKTDIPNLDVIVAGGIADYPTEIFETEKFKNIIDISKEKYDNVLLDCPPLGLVIDVAVAGKYSDGALIVYSMSNIPKENLFMVIEQLEYANINILGLVLNALKKSTHVGYYRYYRKYKYEKSKKRSKK